MKMNLATIAAALTVASLAVPASAVVPVYAARGTPNVATYSFQATGTGNLTAFYLSGRTRAYRGELYVVVNGVERGPFFTTSDPAGEVADFGAVTEGDTLEFIYDLRSPAKVSTARISSIVGNSSPEAGDDGLQQIYSTSYTGGDFGIPVGDYTFVAFEDILGRRDQIRNNDFDYNDFRFAFSNLTPAIPEPATWAMLIAGFGMVGFALRRRASGFTAVAA